MITRLQSAEMVDHERPLGPAMLRGLRQRCPSCGTGSVFDGFLKVRDRCIVCDEELHHQRADDGPAYLTILIVAKLVTPLIYVVFVWLRPDPLVLSTAFSVVTVALALFLLPRLKGMMVAIQWAKRMHGFAADPR